MMTRKSAIDAHKRKVSALAKEAEQKFNEGFAATHARYFALVKDMTPETAALVVPPLGYEPLVTGRCRCPVCRAERKK